MLRSQKQVTIPDPYENVSSLRATALATKELVEALAGQRGSLADIAVTWQDLLDLGLIKPEQVPRGLGSRRV
jgi:hypothetical protein